MRERHSHPGRVKCVDNIPGKSYRDILCPSKVSSRRPGVKIFLKVPDFNFFIATKQKVLKQFCCPALSSGSIWPFLKKEIFLGRKMHLVQYPIYKYTSCVDAENHIYTIKLWEYEIAIFTRFILIIWDWQVGWKKLVSILSFSHYWILIKLRWPWRFS